MRVCVCEREREREREREAEKEQTDEQKKMRSWYFRCMEGTKEGEFELSKLPNDDDDDDDDESCSCPSVPKPELSFVRFAFFVSFCPCAPPIHRISIFLFTFQLDRSLSLSFTRSTLTAQICYSRVKNISSESICWERDDSKSFQKEFKGLDDHEHENW